MVLYFFIDVKSRENMVTYLDQIQRKCERSVITAYQGLKAVGIEEMQVFQSCVQLYLIYHPESSTNEARLLVSEWIDYHINENKKNGKTRGCNCS